MLSAQGGLNQTSSGVLVSQTIGQTSVTGNYSNRNLNVGQGFQQSKVGRLHIKGLNKEISLTIFPNPFENQITISYNAQELVNVTIFDMTGKLIYKNNLSFISVNNTIDVSFFSTGVYLVRLQSKLNTSYTKIVKR
tara:strand:+ start:388 stop:795 length:408 start_codon:yes stop_codon:yes gene_type:complete